VRELPFGRDDQDARGGDDHAAEDQSLAASDPGMTSNESWLMEASKLAWKIATSSTLRPVIA
jgi:hypothetical protein